jgi:hypothetical protein
MDTICEARCEKKGLFFKNLFDLFMQITPLNDKNPSIRQVCFKVSPFGFEIYTNFENYVYIISRITCDFFSHFSRSGDEISFGVSLEHLKNIFKNAKRNDNIVFKINGFNGEAMSMNIDIIKENLSHDVLFVNEIKVTLVQNELLDYSDRISNGVEVHHHEYLTICRSILSQSGSISISRKENNLKFLFNQNELSSSNIMIGKPFGSEIPTSKFNAHCFKNTHKLTNFGTPVNIYFDTYQPLVLESKTNLFSIRIWLKSNEQLTLE